MTEFNLNSYILVQITEYGWNELKKQYSKGFIEACIIAHKQIVNGEDWYKLQAHNIPDYFGNMLWMSFPSPIKPVILIP